MYDWPETQQTTDAFWNVIRAALLRDGMNAPVSLSRPEDVSLPWSQPALVLGQTCGLPFVSGRCGEAVLVGRPTYGVEGTGRGTYSSAIVARRDQPAGLEHFLGKRVAINDWGSQSGCNALIDTFADLGIPEGTRIFSDCIVTGSHRASANLVASGEADIAAIDAVSWELHRLFEPALHSDLRVIRWTREMPSVPFITASALAGQVEELRNAINQGIAEVDGAGIPTEILYATPDDFAPIHTMARRVASLRLI